MSYIVRDWSCDDCGLRFEKLVDRKTELVACPDCGQLTSSVPSVPNIAWMRMGVDRDFPTCADKWEKAHAKQRVLESKQADD